MSAMGQKQTFCVTAVYVRFARESGSQILDRLWLLL